MFSERLSLLFYCSGLARRRGGVFMKGSTEQVGMKREQKAEAEVHGSEDRAPVII